MVTRLERVCGAISPHVATGKVHEAVVNTIVDICCPEDERACPGNTAEACIKCWNKEVSGDDIKEPCPYCQHEVHRNYGGRTFFTLMPNSFRDELFEVQISKTEVAFIESYSLHVEIGPDTAASLFECRINYCPVCGRSLTDND